MKCCYTRFGFACDRVVRDGPYCWQHRPPTEEERKAAREKRMAEDRARWEKGEAEANRRHLERDAGVRPDQIAKLSDGDLRAIVAAGGLAEVVKNLWRMK